MKKSSKKVVDKVAPKAESLRLHHPRHSSVIFDVMYGFIPITEWEEKIINSPFFQRLRWIKQLGFANYVFPGAEHNRFGHVIGVMHSMDQMIRALGINVPQHELFDPHSRSEAALLHKSLRIAALLHDVGTFPFSHAIEFAYMRHGNGVRSERKSKKVGGNTKTPKSLPNNHEHLGSFIIKNTRYDQGITQILEEYGLDVQLISNIIKGDSRYQIANQLMHSDLDADRMDYLLRDSHYTGLKYGQFDRDYILANLVTYGLPDGQMAFGVRENAAHAVEDFLIARFSWYSQVIKSQSTAKFDILASQIAKNLLEQDLIYQFHDLLTMIEERDERFFWFNDIYFINRCFEIKEKKLLKDPKHTELTDMLLYRQAPKIVRHPLLQHRIIKNDKDGSERIRHVNQIIKLEQKFNQIIKVHGTGREWIFVDIPLKDVTFTKSPYSTKKLKTNSESVKIVSHRGVPELLVNRSNSLMKHLSEFNNFIPSAYANASAIQLLRKYKAI